MAHIEWVIAHIWMSHHGPHMNQSWPTYAWVIAHIEWVIAHIWMSHGMHVKRVLHKRPKPRQKHKHTPRRSIGLFCVFIGFFCVFIGLLCVSVGLFGVSVRPKPRQKHKRTPRRDIVIWKETYMKINLQRDPQKRPTKKNIKKNLQKKTARTKQTYQRDLCTCEESYKKVFFFEIFF
jgi:hypothetical protein